MPPDPSDWETGEHFERWKNGDESAFAALHARFAPLLRARIRRHPAWPVLDGHFQVDDVLGDAWLRAVPAMKEKFQYIGTGSLLAFLGQLTDCEVTDQARRHSAQKRGDGQVQRLQTHFEAQRGLPGRSVAETPTGQARTSEWLRLAQEVLTPREYEAWDLVELQQYTSDEAGLALGCSGEAVRSLKDRARKKLVLRLGEEDSAP